MPPTKHKRIVAVVTGARSDYGILRPVLSAIAAHPRMELKLLVTGMHLLRRFGYTVRQIEQDGWPIAGRIRLQGERDDPITQGRGLGRAITGLTDALAACRAQIVLVLGDRIEAFAAAAAATASNRILAHIHGGDAAVGVQDDAYRHAITKLAHVHFAASSEAKRRLKRLGEPDFRIYQTGSPAVDNLSRLICRDERLLGEWAGFDVREDFLLVLQHPAGGSGVEEERRMRQTLAACRHKDMYTIALYPNSDPGFSGILRAARRESRRKRFRLLRSVPREIYLGLLERCRILVGNSSSGLIEAGYLNVDVINVGPRQLGRPRSPNVRDVPYGPPVNKAVAEALGRRRTPRRRRSLYGDGNSGRRIAAILARLPDDACWRQKRIAY
ncbi:MAG: UDP-N-acetylglucosamine 2-epimerase (hydrolyzing) [Sedimentisphaerales bacterium]|nr:UDP-N-acetylglucosamine 2-epimerase (hydrolyzing) [Sedimentisphaerales bacterium]